MGHRITAISFAPPADSSQHPPSWSLRGLRSGRTIGPGEEVTAEDGDLVLTMANKGAVIPSCSVSFVFDVDPREVAISEALFGWLA